MARFRLSIASLAMVLVMASGAFGATPTISSISPSSATAGGAAITLTVNGTNFATGTFVVWNSSSMYSATVVSSTKLTAVLPSTLFAAAGTVTIYVGNPTSATTATPSNGVTFTILAPTTTSSTSTTTTSPLAISTTSVPTGTTGTAYSATLTATGGTAPYTWSVSSGALPPGLSMSTAGAISGTPTMSGSYSFVGAVKDSASHSASYTYSTSIANGTTTTTASLNIKTTPLPYAYLGQPYDFGLQATGGTPPYTWSPISSTIFTCKFPPGMAMFPIGVIFGIPTSTGQYTICVQVKDAEGNVAAAPSSMVLPASLGVSQSAVTITPTSLSPGTTGTAYYTVLQDLTLRTGTLSITSGALPPGLALSAPTGYLTGTPTQIGSYSFSVVGIDLPDNRWTHGTYTISIAAP